MYRKIALAFALAAAGSAFADDGTYSLAAVTGAKTRAETMAEFHAARQAGINPFADEYNPVLQMQRERSRQEVTREYLATRDLVSAMTGEDSGSAYLAHRGAAQEPPLTQMAASPDGFDD